MIRLSFAKLPIFEFKHNSKKIAIDKNTYLEEFQDKCGQRRVENSAVYKCECISVLPLNGC